MTVQVGYNNLLEAAASTVTASSEAAGFEVENCYDWMTWDWWKVSAPETFPVVSVDLGSALEVDYVAIYSHDLGTLGAEYRVQYSIDNFAADINDAFTWVAPSDDRPIFKTFTSQTKRYWRVMIRNAGGGGTLQPLVGVLSIGMALDVGKGAQINFTPPLLYSSW